MQRVDQGAHEARRIGTIIHTVIKGQVQGQTQSGRNGKVVDVSLHYGLQSAASQPKDGHFRVIDDGRKGRPTNGTRVGDGECTPLEVVAVHLAMAHLLDQRGEFHGQLGHALTVHITHHRDNQAPFGAGPFSFPVQYR